MRSQKINGFGALEIFFGVFLLGFLLLVFNTGLDSLKQSGKQLTAQERCESVAESIINGIMSLDKSIVVRNYIPDDLPQVVVSNADDPICNESTSRSLCDTVDAYPDPISQSSDGRFEIFTAQNIRGAMTWAQNIYNNNNPNICTGVGLSFLESGPVTFDNLFEMIPGLTSAKIGNISSHAVQPSPFFRRG